jgi:hypothetical protein
MVKALLRILAFLVLAAGFVAVVMDGARSLAGSELEYAPLSSALGRLLGGRFDQAQAAIERNLHPLLWDPVMLGLGMAPASLVLLGLGLLLHRLGRRPASGVGYLTRR